MNYPPVSSLVRRASIALVVSFTAVACEKPAQSVIARPEPPAQRPQPTVVAPPPVAHQAPSPAQEPAPSEPPNAPQAPPLPGVIPSPFTPEGTRRTCGQLQPRAGFECVETPDGPVHVLAQRAAPTVDPCSTAYCPEGTRCQATTHNIGNAEHRLPHCVATGPLPNVTPTRDPCAAHLCPLGYHCTAPADAPYCVPQSAGW